MILPEKIEKRFQRIECEYAARDRLAHHGLRYRQTIPLYGPPGCGKMLARCRAFSLEYWLTTFESSV